MDHVQEVLSVSERRACKVLGQHRSTQRKPKVVASDEARLTADIIRLAEQYGRYGYRRITALLRREGWSVNAKRVARIWRREGLKVPQVAKRRLSAGVYGLTMAPVSGSGLSTRTMSGRTTSSLTGRMMARPSGC